MERFRPTNAIRTTLTSPLDKLMSFGDENNLRISCPNVEIWNGVWNTITVVENCMETDVQWRTLFAGKLPRLLPIEERLSLPFGKDLPIWATVDAKLDTIDGVSWRDRGFSRFAVVNV